MKREQFLTAGAAAAAGVAGSGGIARGQATPLRLNIFGGLDAWPMYVLHDKGFLTGYDLALTTTTGSVPQFQHVMAGDADLASTAFDNVVAYDAGQGDPSITGDLDFFAFLGVGPGALRLVVRPEITSYEQLRGKAFAVDAPGTGFSFVLRRMLEKNGILPGEYTLISLGSTQKRFDGMVAGQCVGGVIGAPFDIIGAKQYGFRVLGSALDVLGHYQAGVMMARRSWAATHRPVLIAFVRAYRAAAAWLYAPANRAEAMAILARNTDLTPDIIAQVTPGVLGSAGAYTRDGAFDLAGVKTVMELRAAYAVPKKQIADPQAFIDARYL
ncbi:MAG TPA: ABC transporter substrate-binding protein [Candidatus Lustribacter sp.]|jgi:ABC-type nitrate/sulfonate/bicarbonate transport system substrate-binding protein|nr:ABC transporter substrate-binding protein [Candidatus Lustribacter sp.]